MKLETRYKEYPTFFHMGIFFGVTSIYYILLIDLTETRILYEELWV